MTTVFEAYQSELKARSYASDAGQLAAVAALQRCADDWAGYRAQRSSILKKLISRPEIPRGVYLYGGVGRGKSFLMDCFFGAVTVQRKVRLHFHEFMREVHRELTNLQGTVNPLDELARQMANLIQYVRETGFQNMAATVLEEGLKPKSDISFDLVATAVVKIATYVKASTEILQDAPMMQSYIDGRLRYMLAYVEESQLLNGSGVGNNLNGINTQATAYVAPFIVTGATRIDQLRLALLQSELAEFPGTGIVMHPADWAAIELLKDSTGAYIFANPQSLAQPALWGRPVVGTQAMALTNFLVGAFKLGAQVFDRMQSNVVVATENEDDFIKNMVTILAEERLGLAVYRPQAFVKGALI